MLKYKTLYIFSFIIALISCSSPKKENIGIVSVDLDIINRSKAPDVNPKSRIGSYGPVSDDDTVMTSTNKDKEVLGVFISPSLYRSIDSLKVLGCLEKLNKTPSVISGIGLASVMASLYAQGDTTDIIEWKMFKALRSIKEAPYSKKWLKKIDRFIKKNVSMKSLKKSKKSLWVPVVTRNGDVKYTAKVDYKILNNVMNFNSVTNPVHKQYLEQIALNKLPVDRLLVISSIGEKINLKNRNHDYLFGIYGKAFSQLQKINNDKVILVKINNTNSLDDIGFEGSTSLSTKNCENFLAKVFER